MIWITEIKAIDPESGEMRTWEGPDIPAPSREAAEKYCQENGLGYCKVVGLLCMEWKADTTFEMGWEVFFNEPIKQWYDPTDEQMN